MPPSQSQIEQAARELTETIVVKLAELADDLIGHPKFGTDEWIAEHKRRKSQGAEVAMARLREWHLVKIRIARAAGVDPTGDAINARKHGASWAHIGEACGTTRQAAFDRWGKYADR